MRPKDWADHEADRLYDVICEIIDDDMALTEMIASSLRKAARDFHEERVTGPIGEHPDLES